MIMIEIYLFIGIIFALIMIKKEIDKIISMYNKEHKFPTIDNVLVFIVNLMILIIAYPLILLYLLVINLVNKKL